MVRAAIVGLGWWGYTLVESVRSDSRLLRFTTGVVRDPAPAAEFATAHDMVPGTDLDEALRDPRIDAVVLATPHSQHVDQVPVPHTVGVSCRSRTASRPRCGKPSPAQGR